MVFDIVLKRLLKDKMKKKVSWKNFNFSCKSLTFFRIVYWSSMLRLYGFVLK